ncbi:MAG: DUF507 family protein [Thermoanaerobaculia bacterium]
MHRLSRDRIQSLARLVADELASLKGVRVLRDTDAIRQSVGQALTEEAKREEEKAKFVIDQITKMSGAPAPGSREWTTLFQKIYECEPNEALSPTQES